MGALGILLPSLVEVAFKNPFGRVEGRIYLRPFTLKDLAWIDDQFSTNTEGDNGAEILGHAIARLDQDALFLVAHHQAKGLPRKWRTFAKFRRALWGKMRHVQTLVEAYAKIMHVSFPQEDPDDLPEKKSPAA